MSAPRERLAAAQVSALLLQWAAGALRRAAGVITTGALAGDRAQSRADAANARSCHAAGSRCCCRGGGNTASAAGRGRGGRTSSSGHDATGARHVSGADAVTTSRTHRSHEAHPHFPVLSRRLCCTRAPTAANPAGAVAAPGASARRSGPHRCSGGHAARSRGCAAERCHQNSAGKPSGMCCAVAHTCHGYFRPPRPVIAPLCHAAAWGDAAA